MEKSFEGSSMRNEIAIIAGPREWGDTRESWLNRVPPKVKGVTFRMVKELWYVGAKNPHNLAAIAIRDAAARITARKEVTAASAQFSTIAAGLHEIDPEIHRDHIAAYLDMARKLGRFADGE